MTTLFNFLIDGGPLQMFPILALLTLIIVLLIKGFINKGRNNSKTFSLVSSLALLALVLGIFWQMIGLVHGFDIISKANGISPSVLFAGLKISSYSTLFGLFTFMIARLGIIVLTLLQKEEG